MVAILRASILCLLGAYQAFGLQAAQGSAKQPAPAPPSTAQTPVAGQPGQSLSPTPEPRPLSITPIKVELSQVTKSQSWVDLIGTLAWPFLALVGLLLLHKPLGQLLTDIGKRASEISVGVLSLKLPTVPEAPVGGDVGAFKTMEGIQIANDSAKTALFKEFRTPGYRQFLVIKLGNGKEWLSSRLFIFALMLQRMKGIRAIVFVESVSTAAGNSICTMLDFNAREHPLGPS